MTNQDRLDALEARMTELETRVIPDPAKVAAQVRELLRKDTRTRDLARKIDSALTESQHKMISEYLIPTRIAAESSLKVLDSFSDRLDRLGKIGNRLIGPAYVGVALGIAGMALSRSRRVNDTLIHLITSSHGSSFTDSTGRAS